jgi:Bacterial Ig-like domain
VATPKQFRRRSRWSLIIGVVFAALTFGAVFAYASDANEAIVDTTAPTGSVTLAPGGSGSITINLTVTGNQAGTATFNVNRDWTLSGGTFTGSNPQTFTVPPRAAQDPAATFSTTGTVTVDSGQSPGGPFTLSAGVFDITNSNSAGAKLGAGSSSSYAVTVSAPADTAPSVSSTTPANNATDVPVDSDVGITFSEQVNVSGSWFGISCASSGAHTAVASGGPTTWTLNPGTDFANSELCTVTVNAANVSDQDSNDPPDNMAADYSFGFTTAAPIVPADSTAPNISYVLNPASPDGNNGWYKSNVTLTWTVTENESPGSLVKNGCVDQNITADQAATTYSCSATSDGGSAGPVDATIKRDATAPSVVYTSALPAPNGAGWNNTDVVATFTATDTLSGFAGPSTTETGTSTTSGEGSAVTVGSPAFTDFAGNTAAAGAATSDPFKIDKTAPTVSVTGVTNGATYTLGSVPAAGCSTSDSLSLVQTNATLSSSGGPVGSTTAMCSGGEDNADNTASPVSVTYNVIYAWTGFFQPVDNLPTLNSAKAGSAIPVKFNLGGNQGLNIFASGYPTSNTAFCDAEAGNDTVETTVNAGLSSLTYDTTANQYIYVWKTDKLWAGQCRQLRVKLIDGTVHAANFKFK